MPFMDPLNDQEVADMRALVEETLTDTCVLLPYSPETKNSVGQRTGTWADGPTLPCLYLTGGNREVSSFQQSVVSDARLQLPWNAVDLFGAKDRVRLITIRRHLLQRPLTFEVVGVPEVTLLDVMLNLHRVEV